MSSPETLGPVPEENKPGHHPAREQDKPDPDAFARRLGLAGDQTGGTTAERHPPIDDHGAGTSRPSAAARSRSPRRGPSFEGPAPVSPVDPAELVAEAVELSVKTALTLAFLPWRLTAATLKAGLRIARSD
jgi:hypothetical protein